MILVDTSIKLMDALLELDECQFISRADEISAQHKSAQALLVRSGIKVNAQLLDRLPSLSFVGSPIAGSDHLDLFELKQRGISCSRALGCNAIAVRDYLLAMLAASGHLLALLHGDSQLGIVGYGKVGSCVVALCRELGISCRVYDPLAPVPADIAAEQLSDLSNCSAISLHCNLHSDRPYPSAKLISADFLAQLNSAQLLLSLARGAVLDEPAAIKRGQQRQMPKIIADTWVAEPAGAQAYFDCVWALTPHIAGHSRNAYAQGLAMVLQDYCAHFDQPMPKLAMAKVRELTLDLTQPHTIQRQIIAGLPLLPLARNFQSHAREQSHLDWQYWRSLFAERKDWYLSVYQSK